jgi:hypothetical protein
MTLTEILSLARGMLDDNQTPYLCSDVELLAYINKTINEFCDKTEILIDSTTTAICRITITSGTAKYALEERVVAIKRARLITYDQRLTKRTSQFMDRYYGDWDSAMVSTGTPLAFLQDVDTGYITLYPTPDAGDTLKLTVSRLPLTQMSLTALTASPEIPFKYHYDLLDGILWRAYSKQDAETHDATKANNHFKLWMAKINEVMLNVINDNDIDNHDDQVPDYLDD